MQGSLEQPKRIQGHTDQEQFPGLLTHFLERLNLLLTTKMVSPQNGNYAAQELRE